MLYIDGEPFECDKIPEEALRKVDFYTSTFDDEYGLNIFLNNSATFQCDVFINEESMLKMLGVWDAIIECCPNRRVVHLFRYAKKRRVRRKNIHRAIKILEETEDDYT